MWQTLQCFFLRSATWETVSQKGTSWHTAPVTYMSVSVPPPPQQKKSPKPKQRLKFIKCNALQETLIACCHPRQGSCYFLEDAKHTKSRYMVQDASGSNKSYAEVWSIGPVLEQWSGDFKWPLGYPSIKALLGIWIFKFCTSIWSIYFPFSSD